ncbi:luciferase family protein [Deinococcus oregonensis]|uniref:Luciferase family protein n=1 Tax=Deinococcus oregonensis TaxID=1805970 RepID=A0ABV6ASD9_9DEIO
MSSHEIQSAEAQILQCLATWPGVTLNNHCYGGIGIFAQGQELGQWHPCGLLDVSLTAVERDMLLKDNRVHRHHTFPDSGWVTLPINGMLDVSLAVKALGLAHACALNAASLISAIPHDAVFVGSETSPHENEQRAPSTCTPTSQTSSILLPSTLPCDGPLSLDEWPHELPTCTLARFHSQTSA